MDLSLPETRARRALLKRGIWPLLDRGETLEAVLTRLIENIEGQADKMLAAVFLYDATRNDLTVGAAPNLQPVYKKAVNGFVCGPDQPACGSAVFKRQRVISVDVSTDPLWVNLREFAEAIGIRAVWSEPIISTYGEVLGTIAFYHPEPKAPDSVDAFVLEAAASLAAEIIQARMEEARTLIRAEAQSTPSRHQCIIYEGPPSNLLPILASTVRRKIAEGWRCLYLNRPAMVSGLRSVLSAMGTDVAREVAEGRLVLSSDSPAPGGRFDTEAMLRLVESALEHAVKDGFKGLWASGDMTWEFGAEKNFAKLLEYEYRLEALFRRTIKLEGLCQYHKDSLPADTVKHALLSHRTVFVNETLSRLNPHYLPGGVSPARRFAESPL